MIPKKKIEIPNIPEPLWAVIQAVAIAEGNKAIQLYAREAVYAATKKANPGLWDKATNAVRDARGIPHAMTLIQPPTHGDT